jgi:hypothetical protein
MLVFLLCTRQTADARILGGASTDVDHRELQEAPEESSVTESPSPVPTPGPTSPGSPSLVPSPGATPGATSGATSGPTSPGSPSLVPSPGATPGPTSPGSPSLVPSPGATPGPTSPGSPSLVPSPGATPGPTSGPTSPAGSPSLVPSPGATPGPTPGESTAPGSFSPESYTPYSAAPLPGSTPGPGPDDSGDDPPVPPIPPSKWACKLDVEGRFPAGKDRRFPDGNDGRFLDGKDGAGTNFVLSYDYEMEYKGNDVPMTLIPAIEKAFGEAVLPILFASNCAVPSPDAFNLAISLSALPKDELAAGTLCKDQKDKDNLCLVYAGKMTVYYKSAVLTNVTAVKETLLKELETSMTKGDFLIAHDGLERLHYIAAEDDDDNDKEESWLDLLKGLVEGEDSQKLIVVGGAAVAILGCCVVGVLFLKNQDK